MTTKEQNVFLFVAVCMSLILMVLYGGQNYPLEIKQDVSFEECQSLYMTPTPEAKQRLEDFCDIEKVEAEIQRVKQGDY